MATLGPITDPLCIGPNMKSLMHMDTGSKVTERRFVVRAPQMWFRAHSRRSPPSVPCGAQLRGVSPLLRAPQDGIAREGDVQRLCQRYGRLRLAANRRIKRGDELAQSRIRALAK